MNIFFVIKKKMNSYFFDQQVQIMYVIWNKVISCLLNYFIQISMSALKIYTPVQITLHALIILERLTAAAWVVSKETVMIAQVKNCILYCHFDKQLQCLIWFLLINLFYWFLKDIDECTLDEGNCPKNSNCNNTVGSFHCVCQKGYQGDGHNCTGKILNEYIWIAFRKVQTLFSFDLLWFSTI